MLSPFFSIFFTGGLEQLFKRLDADGNGTIDYDEFKAGAKREPLLVKAFLAPVQQGSLTRAPAATRKAAETPKLAEKAEGEGHPTSATVLASTSESSPRLQGNPSADAEVAAPEWAGSRSKESAPNDNGVGCAGNVRVGGGSGSGDDPGRIRENCDNPGSKRCRVEGPGREERC